MNVNILRSLMFLNESRGTDATGFFTNKGDWRKSNARCREWMATTDINTWLDAAVKCSWAVCGHTRGGTRGGNLAKNAHPFEYGPIVGSHNGVVDCPNKYAVDSEYAMDLLSEHKPGDIQEALKDLAGWYVLTWFDKRNKSVYLLNWQGGLHMTEYDGAYYYSSEEAHLVAAIGCKAADVTAIAHTNALRFYIDKATNTVRGERLDDFTGKFKETKQTNTYWERRDRKREAWGPDTYVMKFPDDLWYAKLNNGRFQLLKETMQTHLNNHEWFGKGANMDLKFYGQHHSGKDMDLKDHLVPPSLSTPIVEPPKDWKKPTWSKDEWDDDTKVLGLPQSAREDEDEKKEREAAMDDAYAALQDAKRTRIKLRLSHLMKEAGLSKLEALDIVDKEGLFEDENLAFSLR